MQLSEQLKSASVLVLVLAGMGLLPAVARADMGPPGSDQGAALFRGEQPLFGRLYTQSEDLPDSVVRCANCHAESQSATPSRSQAPRLDAAWLTLPRRRRGGPATAYDETGFCRALRDGVDPAKVVITVEMPRYRLSESACTALWSYLTKKP